jgi:hypothetical protein
MNREILYFGTRFACRGGQWFQNQIANLKGNNMNTVLHLQELTPTASAIDFDAIFASSLSTVCPTVGDPHPQFELD